MDILVPGYHLLYIVSHFMILPLSHFVSPLWDSNFLRGLFKKLASISTTVLHFSLLKLFLNIYEGLFWNLNTCSLSFLIGLTFWDIPKYNKGLTQWDGWSSIIEIKWDYEKMSNVYSRPCERLQLIPL